MTSSPAPTIWFSAPSAIGSSNPAASQFMNLFSDPSAWQVTASRSVGFALDETFILQATAQQLSQVFAFLNAHHLKMMMVTEMIPVQANGAGQGVEGYTDPGALATALQRITALGGTLNAVQMDGVLYDGTQASNGAQLSVSQLAQQIAPNVALIRAAFPNVQFDTGDGLSTVGEFAQWQTAFGQATGSTIAEFDADVNWNDPASASGLAAYAQAAKAAGAAFGISGNATNVQQGNLSWALSAEANIAAAEANPATAPSNIIVDTWDAYPTVTLPEGLDGTLSHVAVEASQISPLYAAGYLVGGSGVTVATTVPTASYTGSAADAVAGMATAVPGVQLSATGSASAGMTFAVVLTDASGTLGATASGTGKVSGSGTDVMTLTGGFTDINAELASLTYTGAAAGSDMIDVTTYDGTGLVDDHQISVAIATPLTVALPSGISATALYQNIFGVTPSAATLASAKTAQQAGETLAQIAAPWIAEAQVTISLLYEQELGVSASAAALASLTAALTGGQTPAQIRTSLAGSAAVQSELAAVYQSHYGRAPTVAQASAMTQQLASGTSLEAIEAPLLAGSQAETQITALYQAVEGQAPDASDLVTDARALLTGTPIATIRAELATSSLVQANLAALYQHAYDAAPAAAQLTSLTAELEGSTSYAQIQAQFVAIEQASVTAIFQSVLGRTPTTSELNTWTQNLTSGATTQSGIYANLAYSAASAATVTAIYQHDIGQAPPQAMVTELEEVLCIGANPTPLAQLSTDLSTVATLYHQITGQTADATALTPLMYDVLNHAPFSQIAYWIGFSAQENQIIENSYQQLFGDSITGTELNTLKLALVAGTTTMASVQSSLAAQAAADVPVISNVVANQTVTANSKLMVLNAISVTDPDPNAIETATVSVSGNGGHLINGTNLNTAGTFYTTQGNLASVDARLAALFFVPSATGGTSQLSLTIENGAGHSTTTTVAITAESVKSTTGTDFLFAPASSFSAKALLGPETFIFPAASSGTDSINGFVLATDIIQLPATTMSSFAAVQSHESASAGGTLITLGPSSSIFLAGIAPSSLHASNFSFV